MKALTIHNLTKHFDGVRAVNKLSLTIEKGTIVSIIGPNGSGKTTLINLLSGMLDIDSGSLVVHGSRKLGSVERREIASYGITRTFQNVRLFVIKGVVTKHLYRLLIFAYCFEYPPERRVHY